jgi:hypothetical protein
LQSRYDGLFLLDEALPFPRSVRCFFTSACGSRNR